MRFVGLNPALAALGSVDHALQMSKGNYLITAKKIRNEKNVNIHTVHMYLFTGCWCITAACDLLWYFPQSRIE